MRRICSPDNRYDGGDDDDDDNNYDDHEDEEDDDDDVSKAESKVENYD